MHWRAVCCVCDMIVVWQGKEGLLSGLYMKGVRPCSRSGGASCCLFVGLVHIVEFGMCGPSNQQGCVSAGDASMVTHTREDTIWLWIRDWTVDYVRLCCARSTCEAVGPFPATGRTHLARDCVCLLVMQG